jgi:prepilin-type N-terminal cleavage/methylation domain-containing protein
MNRSIRTQTRRFRIELPANLTSLSRTRRLAHSAMPGFTLVEVVIVSVVLTVLLAAVWSLITLQQRTLERGQRLSRQSRVMLAMQRLLQQDLSRAAGDWGTPGFSQRLPAQPPFNNDEAGEETLFSMPRSPIPAIAESDELRAPQFTFAGGSDWLIFDTGRPAYQLGSFDPSDTDEDDSVRPTSEFETSFVTEDSAGTSEDLPTTAPTPFERVIYLWLTDEEILTLTGVTFGHEDTDRPNSFDRSLRDPASDRSENPGPATATDAESQSGSTPMPTLVRRTLVRIRTDWSWPREDEGTGTTWDDALAADASANDSSETAPDAGELSPERQTWLRRLLSTKPSGYRQFHLQNGSAAQREQTAAEADEFDESAEVDGSDFETETENATAALTSQAGSSARLLPNARQPQVDWFPEIVAGKFQYFDGRTWQSSFAQRDDAPLPWAVRFEFQIDANRFPVAVDFSSGDVTEGADRGSLVTLDPRDEPLAASDLGNFSANAMTADRPQYPQVVVWTWRQAASRSESLETFGGLELEGSDEGSDTGAQNESRTTDFADAFEIAAPESGSRP